MDIPATWNIHRAHLNFSLLAQVLLITFYCKSCLSFVGTTTNSAFHYRNSYCVMSVDSQMHGTYEMLCDKIIQDTKNIDNDRQYWICLAGGPGSGKSTLSAAIVQRLNNLLNNADFSVVLPMDGFHFSRQQLREISEQPNSPSFNDLLSRRGSPWTFDANAVCTMLSDARRLKSGL